MPDLDFELAIRQLEGSDYDVAVLRSPAGEAHATMHFPFDGDALQTRLQALEIALLRSGGTRRQLDSADGQAVRDFGRELFDALIAGDVRGRFDASLAEADHAGKPLRIRLRFETPALAALPWEFLHDRRQPDYLVLSSDTPLVRYIEVPEVIKPLTVIGPLRILGVVASPTDLAPLDVERERTRIQEATADLRARGLVELHWLDPPTPRELQQALRLEKWHIFHFAGHGGFNPAIDEGVIAMADEAGAAARLPATQLGRLLGDHKPLRLAVLNACEGARGSTHDLFSSTAATLVRRGTPAVVAMQYEITDEAAKEFSRSFYEAIADGSPVDLAVAEARKSVSIQMTSSLEWGTPVLFMRTDDGVLFKIRRTRTRPPDDLGASPAAAAGAGPSVPPAAATDANATPVVAAANATPAAATSTTAAVAGPATSAVVTGRGADGSKAKRRQMFVVAGGAGVLALGALVWLALLNGGSPRLGPSSSPGGGASSAVVSPGARVEIAVALQGQGSAISNGILHGIELALTDAGHQAGTWQVAKPTVVMYDATDPANGTANLQSIVARADVIAVIGPQTSGIAKLQIPISNKAGLLQCSPSTASDGLTKPPDGPKLRESRPSDINFVRTVTTNTADAPAAAQYILENLRKSRVFVVDDGVASALTRKGLFTDYFKANGGTVVGEASLKGSTIAAAVDLARAADPDVIYFSGSAGARPAMTELFVETREDFGTIPYVMSGEIRADSTFSASVGARATSNIFTFVAAADDFLGSTAFRTKYTAAFGIGPEPYSSTAYACAAVILDALKRVEPSANLADLREKVRVAAVDPTRQYETVLGSFHFDANGDTSQQIVTVYRYDPKNAKFQVEGYVDLGT